MTFEKESFGAAEVHHTPTLRERMEDNVLQSVPAEQRKSGWALSLNSMSAATPLICLAIAGTVVSRSGVLVGLLAAVLVTVFGTVVGWLVGHITYLEGVSNTVSTRLYGLGIRGSALASGIFAFMTLGFLAIENVLLYHAIEFMFDIPPTTVNKVLIYGGLTVLWIVLTAFGMSVVTRTSGLLLALGAVFIVVVTAVGLHGSGVPLGDVMTQGPTVPGAGGFGDRFQFALVTLVASTGSLALTAADYTRYARTTRDVGVTAFAGSLVINMVLVVFGALIFSGGRHVVERYLIDQGKATGQTAGATAVALSETNAGAFLIAITPLIGFLLACALQAKIQVLNTYSSSLALTNLSDGLLRRRPARVLMVVLGNAIGLVMVFAGILDVLNTWLGILGVITTSLIGVIIADFYLVRRRVRADPQRAEAVNWAGVTSVAVASVLGETLQESDVFSLGFVISFFAGLIVYPMLRRSLLPHGTGTTVEPVGLARLTDE